MNKKLIKNIFFPLKIDQELIVLLKGKWWHRLLSIIYVLLILGYFIVVAFSFICIFFALNRGIFTAFLYFLFYLIVPYFCLIFIQFIYFDIFQYIVCGKKDNLLHNLRIVFKLLLISAITFFALTGIILLLASEYCGYSSRFDSYSMEVKCVCSPGYTSNNRCISK